MSTLSLTDLEGSFDVTVLRPAASARVVLFAVGGGGDPSRHRPLLEGLAERGATVVAPHFARLVAPRVTEADLLLRARRLRLAVDQVAGPEDAVVGVGHSIGATTLLALAGGRAWLGPGHCASIPADPRLRRLALLTPATGFFQAEGALDAVQVPIVAWSGTNDVITPPDQAAYLARVMGASVDLRCVEGAGHFSFMNTPPPNTVEPLADRDAFLTRLAREVTELVFG